MATVNVIAAIFCAAVASFDFAVYAHTRLPILLGAAIFLSFMVALNLVVGVTA